MRHGRRSLGVRLGSLADGLEVMGLCTGEVPRIVTGGCGSSGRAGRGGVTEKATQENYIAGPYSATKWVSLSPFLTGRMVCSPKMLRTVRRTIDSFSTELRTFSSPNMIRTVRRIILRS